MNFTYIIFDINELSKVEVAELLPFSAEPIRVSVNREKVFVKYIGNMPLSIQALTTKSQEYTFEQIQKQLQSQNWGNWEGPLLY